MRKKPAVVLFTYNRADKAFQVLEALTLQYNGKVYIFCDGPRNIEDMENVDKNIEMIKSFKYPKKEIFISNKNQGLSNSIVSGISKIFKQENSLIILEDDCLPFPGMIKYMIQNLENWYDIGDVFSISAYHFIRDQLLLDRIPFDVFFSNRFIPWGWATWKDRWHRVESRLRCRANPYGSFRTLPESAGMDMLFHVYAIEQKLVDSWAVPLALITLSDNYRHVMPAHPLVNNIGMDDSGTNTSAANNRIVPVPSPHYPKKLRMCPEDYENHRLTQAFADSLSVLMPAKWFQDKVLTALTTSDKKPHLRSLRDRAG